MLYFLKFIWLVSGLLKRFVDIFVEARLPAFEIETGHRNGGDSRFDVFSYLKISKYFHNKDYSREFEIRKSTSSFNSSNAAYLLNYVVCFL